MIQSPKEQEITMTEKKETPKLKDAVKSLTDAIDGAMKHFATIAEDDVPALLKSFKALKEHKEELDELQTALSSFYNRLSYEIIPSTFERLEYDSVKVSGRNFVVGSRLNASIPQDKRQEGFKWLEEHGLGSLIQPNVNPKSLSSAILSYFEEHAEEPPKEAITIHRQKYTSVRKA